MHCGHYSERVRRDGLGGLADLLAKHPPELRRHAGPIVERLAERVADPSAGPPSAAMQPDTALCLEPGHRASCCCPLQGGRAWRDEEFSSGLGTVGTAALLHRGSRIPDCSPCKLGSTARSLDAWTESATG